MNDRVVAVFGGDGFVGRYVVQNLLREGARVRVASRNPKRGWFLKAQAGLGQLAYVAADVTNPSTVKRALSGADEVINLVGSFANMDAVQHRGAATVATAAAESNIGRLVHVSAIGSDPDSPSRYGKSKADGEAAVLSAFPHAVILRPSIIFGREDQFINRFAALIRMLPVVPVFAADRKFQPVFVGDVAHSICSALRSNIASGRIFELGGPKIYTMLALNKWIAEACGRDKLYFPVSDLVAGAMARLTGWLPGAPMSWDQWLMLQSDNVTAAGALGLAELGIEPTSLDTLAPGWLVQFRKHGRFGATA